MSAWQQKLTAIFGCMSRLMSPQPSLATAGGLQDEIALQPEGCEPVTKSDLLCGMFLFLREWKSLLQSVPHKDLYYLCHSAYSPLVVLNVSHPRDEEVHGKRALYKSRGRGVYYR